MAFRIVTPVPYVGELVAIKVEYEEANGHTFLRGAERFPRCDVTPLEGRFQGRSRPNINNKNVDFTGAP